MSEDLIKNIYDTLFNLEASGAKGTAYPIHKKLVFDNEEIKDIYEWLNKNIDIPPGSNILDAGCGVGYGTCLIANNSKVNVTGISLSQKEIDLAKLYAHNKKLNHKTNFECKSFDNIEPNTYDIIIAVESLKHSLNLENTLTVLSNALTPDGQIIIVEDFYTEDKLSLDASKYINDWGLIDAFRLNDYYKILKMSDSKITDLTTYMSSKNSFLLTIKIFVL
ncbi:MAG: class I SAM-dependent methyltransferase, partial [Saprospiraceae bacterium]